MSQLQNKIIRKELLNENLQRNAAEASRDHRKFWLDKNENTDSIFHEFILNKLKNIDTGSHFHYPDCGGLYQKIADIEKLSVSNLLLTAGSDGAIRAVFESCINPGDKIIKTNPSFAMYEVYSKMFGAVARDLVYQKTETGPKIFKDDILAAIKNDGAKIFFLPNPDSPTGTVLTPAELDEIIVAAEKVDCVVFIDEAYFPFYKNTVLPLVNKYRNLLVARTYAKAWGLAGLRVGFLAGHPDLMKYISKIKPMYEVNTYGLRALEMMLDCEKEMKESVTRLKNGRDYFFEKLKPLNLPTFTSHGNFFHVSFGDKEEKLFAALNDLVLYRRNFNEACLKGYSRFSLAPSNIYEPLVKKIMEIYGK